MPKIIILNPEDSGVNLIVLQRFTRDGTDGPQDPVAPGEAASVDLAMDHHVVVLWQSREPTGADAPPPLTAPDSATVHTPSETGSVFPPEPAPAPASTAEEPVVSAIHDAENPPPAPPAEPAPPAPVTPPPDEPRPAETVTSGDPALNAPPAPPPEADATEVTTITEADVGEVNTAAIEPEKAPVEPRDPSNDEIEEVIRDLMDDPDQVYTTAAGMISVAALNAKLAAAGFNPVDAAKRDEVHAALVAKTGGE